MNPLLKKNPQMNEQEKKLFEMYGKKPAKNVLSNMQKERKYFDSGDYAMHKAGVSSDLGGTPLAVGKAIPTPEGLPHASPPSLSSSPTGTSMSPPGPNPLQPHVHGHGGPALAVNTASGSGGGSTGVGSPAPTSSNPLLAPQAHGVPSGSHLGHGHGHGGSSPGGSIDGGSGVGVGMGSGMGIAIPGAGRSDPRRSPPTAFSPLANAGAADLIHRHGSISKTNVPPSSFPIQHAHGHRESMSMSSGGSVGAALGGGSGAGGSPVKLQGGMDRARANENAVEDEDGMEMD